MMLLNPPANHSALLTILSIFSLRWGGDRFKYNSLPVDLATDIRSSSFGCCSKWSSAADISSPASLSSNECGNWNGFPTSDAYNE